MWMKYKQFRDNYRIWERHYIVTPDGKRRIYEKGDMKYILYNGLKGLLGGLIFIVAMFIILSSIV